LTKLKNDIELKLKRWEANINKSRFYASELIRAFFSHRPHLRILFSERPERETFIRKGFRFLPHQLDFDVFTPENISKSDLVIPLTMLDLRNLDQVRHLIQNNPIPIPSLQAVNICDDKYLFCKTLEEKGFGNVIPETGPNLPYPYMLKKKVSEGGYGCYIISNAEEEKELKHVINDPDYFCQQTIEGKNEYATHVFFKDHKIVSSINIKYFFSNDTFVKGKDKSICTKISKCPYLDLFSSILDAIDYEGLCCFNYKVVNGKPLILEINPRFGASLSMFFFSFIRRLEFEKLPKAS
jgi:predicted ATP-grasp superfamily ATP-dependent carboligase